MPLFDYRCDSGHITERNNHWSVVEVPCGKCDSPAHKALLSAPSIGSLRMGVDTAFPTAADKWARVHRQETEKARKKEAEFQHDVGRLPSWYDKEVQ